MKENEPLNSEAILCYAMSLRYLGAANKLYGLNLATGKATTLWPWYSPIYFLYFHAIELALKAYLFSFNINVRRTHDLIELYRQSRNRRLPIAAGERARIGNVIRLLDSHNKGRGFRYFGPESWGNLPELSWTRHETNRLIKAVGRRMRRLGFSAKPGPATRVRLVISAL
jgi:HEPN domain-containing protein